MKKRVMNVLFAVICFVSWAGSSLAADINLSVALGLKDVVTELSSEFEKKNPGTAFQRNFAASGALAKQIANGAPCDVYLSANVEWMNYLKGKMLVDTKTVANFAFSQLVFVGKPGLHVKTLQDVVTLDRVAIGSPKSVPAGQYAMEAIKSAKIDRQMENKLVMAKDVRECLMYAERGEVDGAFVYRTDAAFAKHAKILFIVPQNYYPRVTFLMALTPSGSRKAEAAAFYRFLQSAEAKKVLIRYGFTVN